MREKKRDVVRATKHTDIQQEPHRVASRLEGVVKNVGITPQKKTKGKKYGQN